jgi:hypothetical protein
MQALEELGHFQLPEIVYRSLNIGPCIIMLKYELMAMDEWHDNGPKDLIMVALCIKIAIEKMLLCLSSVTYACPYHNPTMGHSVHNIDISKQLAHTHTHTHHTVVRPVGHAGKFSQMWPFIVPSTRCTCVMKILFNQLLDLPQLSHGWIILAKDTCLLTGTKTKFVDNI